MSSVALRCATCGTTQDHPGECEACSGGEVRYFCTNHNPGLWLEEPLCRRCGAKFGDAPKAEPERSSRSTPVLPAPEPRRRESPRKPEGGLAPRPTRPSRPPVSRPPVSGEGSEDILTTPSLADWLAALAERTRPHHKAEEAWTYLPAEPASRRLSVGGCLLRLVVLIIVVIALVIAALFGLLNGVIL